MRHLVISFWFVLAAWASAQTPATLSVVSTLESVYHQAQNGHIDLVITLNDPDHTVDRGVLFLNVVERDAARTFPQAAHKIFRSADEQPGIFRVAYEGDVLRGGLTTRLHFQLRGGAKVGEYALVVQLYQGDETRPGRVTPSNRVAMKGLTFNIVSN